MALPKLSTPKYVTTLPVSKKALNYRAYNLGDEKLLIAAADSRHSDPEFYLNNTLQVLANCTSDHPGVIDTLPSVDVEYLLMQIRAKSAGETSDVRITVNSGDKKSTFETTIDLTKFYVNERPKDSYVVKLTDTIGMKLREPTFREKISHAVKYRENDNNRTAVIYELIADSVESIYEEDEVSVIGVHASREELMSFLSQISGSKTQELYKFVRDTPQLRIKVNNGPEEIEVSGGQIDFLASRSAIST